jgi:hypothetical protein
MLIRIGDRPTVFRYELLENDGLVKSHKSDGKEKRSRCKARKS